MKCPTVVGRDRESEHLVEALDRLRGGRGGLLFVVGEAGVGKSRLLDEMVARARQRDVRVLSGRAVDSGVPVPYRPLFEALAGHFRRAGAPEHAGLEAMRPALAPLVPEWRRSGEDHLVASPMETAEALLRLLAEIAGDRGVVLALEDLHWSDHETISVLEYLGDNIGDEAILCVATMRPDPKCAGFRAARRLRQRDSCRIEELDRLTDEDLDAMTRRCLGVSEIDAGVSALVRRFADGLPFLVEEILSSAISAGVLNYEDHGWTVIDDTATIVPRGFVDLVDRRLGRLEDDDIGVVRAAAVLGSQFDPGLLPSVTGRTTTEVAAALRSGVSAQLLRADPDDPARFGFRHALTRDAILGGLLPFDRRELSRRCLAALEVHHPHLEGPLCELAASLGEAAGDRERAAELLLASAERAYARSALSSAEPMLLRALGYSDAVPDLRHRIGVLLARVRNDTGDVEGVFDVGRQLLAVTAEPEGRAPVHLEMARAAAAVHRWEVVDRELTGARECAARSGLDSVEAAAAAIGAEAAFGRLRIDEAEALARASLAFAEEHGGPGELACQALQVIGWCARFRGDIDRAGDAFDRMVDIGRSRGLVGWRLRGLLDQASTNLWRLGPTPELIGSLVAARDEAANLGGLVVAAHLENYLACFARDRWASGEADEAAVRCMELSRRLRLDPLVAMSWTVRAIASAQRGDREQMELDIAHAKAADGRSHEVRTMCDVARMTLAMKRDDTVRLRSALETVMDDLGEAPRLPIPERGLWVLVNAAAGNDVDGMLDELARSSGATHHVNVTYRNYALAVQHGRRGDVAAAERHLARAEPSASELTWIQHHARRLMAERALEDGWGDPVGWLRAALDIFEARGDTELASSCRRLLARAGAPVPRRPRPQDAGVPDDLREFGVTARECEVLEYLGSASSTKDIAAEMFISPKTVERHTANLVVKLGLEGRSSLVAFAAARRQN